MASRWSARGARIISSDMGRKGGEQNMSFDDGINRARMDSDPRIARLEADNAHLRGTLETALKGSEGAINAIAADSAQLRRENDSLRALCKQLRDALNDTAEYIKHAAICA